MAGNREKKDTVEKEFLGFPDILVLNRTQEIVMRAIGIFIFGCGNATTYFLKKY